MSAYPVRETWKPVCGHELSDTFLRILRIRHDRCLRKRNHRGRCVGRIYVWDRHKVQEWEERIVKS